MPARLLFLSVPLNGTMSDVVRIRPTFPGIRGFPAREADSLPYNCLYVFLGIFAEDFCREVTSIRFSSEMHTFKTMVFFFGPCRGTV